MTEPYLPADAYAGVFFSPDSVRVMRAGSILPPEMSPERLLSDLTTEIARAEHSLGATAADTERLLVEFADYVRRGLCTLGSPLLTNIAAKHPVLASCTAVPLDAAVLAATDFRLAESYYNLNMGSGYDLTAARDPSDALLRLNAHAEAVESSGSCERYVGNIAHVSVRHPKIFEFAIIKATRSDIVHFNTSIEVTPDFMESVRHAGTFQTSDGVRHSSLELWNSIVESAWHCGDPGILCLDRYNAGNPLAAHWPYVTTAPCAEVGLSAGEVCVFGYINLAACLSRQGRLRLDLDLLGDIADCLTRVLDDALELSLAGAPTALTATVLSAKRKIGIGICGYADTLLWLGMDYGSEQGVKLLQNALAVINYRSKVASLELALERGSFSGFPLSSYATDPSFLTRFAAPGLCVQSADWRELAENVRKHGLRHVMTTALPPAGRSALLLGVNPSLEPYLELDRQGRWVRPIAAQLATGRACVDHDLQLVSKRSQDGSWPQAATSDVSLFRTAPSIDVQDHMRVAAAAAALVDDGVSKTINLHPSNTREDVSQVYLDAWTAGLKAISIFRDICRP